MGQQVWVENDGNDPVVVAASETVVADRTINVVISRNSAGDTTKVQQTDPVTGKTITTNFSYLSV